MCILHKLHTILQIHTHTVVYKNVQISFYNNIGKYEPVLIIISLTFSDELQKNIEQNLSSHFKSTGKFYASFFYNSSMNTKVNELFKSVHISQIYYKNRSCTFLWTTVYLEKIFYSSIKRRKIDI